MTEKTNSRREIIRAKKNMFLAFLCVAVDLISDYDTNYLPLLMKDPDLMPYFEKSKGLYEKLMDTEVKENNK